MGPPPVLYYDGQCRLCVGIARLLRFLDVMGSLRFQPYQDLTVPPNGLSWNDLECSAYLGTSSGRMYEGFFAFRMLALRVPTFWLLTPLLWFPGVSILGRAVYRWVAANRRRFGSCRKPDPEVPLS